LCGIFGIIGGYDRQNVERSLETMQNRGPDGSRIVEFDGGCFAQSRLAIIAPSREFDPPFIDEGKFFVFNGELYNFKHIQDSFGIKPHKSDSMTAFAAIRQDLSKFLKTASGMYAFAYFDRQKNSLILGRDRFGKKPLYYTLQGSKFIFASSLDAIKPHLPLKFRRDALKSYLSYHACISPGTFYEDVYKLPAGHTLVYDGKKVEIHKYYDFFGDDTDERSLDELLLESVRDRLVSDVEVGAFLSGGIDSSYVCALAQKELAKSGKKLRTFCVGYDGFEQHDERAYARESAKHIGSAHHEITFGKNDFLDYVEKSVLAFDEPLSDPACVPIYTLGKMIANNGIKCVLSGEGGDEAFGGYQKYRLFLQMMEAKKLPFNAYLGGFLSRHPEQNREWEWYRRIFSDEIPYRTASEDFTDEQKATLLNCKVNPNDSTFLIKEFWDEYVKSGQKEYSVWMSYIDIRVWLGEVLLQKADKIGMANSLEIRCPLMDHKVLAKALSMGDARITDESKTVLKNLATDLVSPKVLGREKKGFTYPFNKWIFEGGNPDIVFEINKQTQFFKKPYLEFLYKQAKDGKFKHQFWSVYIFSRWFASRF